MWLLPRGTLSLLTFLGSLQHSGTTGALSSENSLSCSLTALLKARDVTMSLTFHSLRLVSEVPYPRPQVLDRHHPNPLLSKPP